MAAFRGWAVWQESWTQASRFSHVEGIRIDIPVWNAAAHKFSEDLETRIRMQVTRSTGSIVSQVEEAEEDRIYSAWGRQKQETEEKPRKYFGQHLHVTL